jgi:Spy/CpxP family protein refolding chaperone
MLSVTRVAGVVLLAGSAILVGSGAVWGFDDKRSGRDQDKQTAGKAAAPQTPSGGQVQPSAGRGRGPGPGDVRAWWKDRDMAKEVGLSSVQIAKIDLLYEQRKKQIKSKVDEYNKLRDELERMLKERTAKPEDIENQAKKMMFPRYDIDVSRTKMLYEMSLVLSADQNTRFLAMFDRMDQERRAAMEKLEQERAKGRRGGGNHQRQ